MEVEGVVQGGVIIPDDIASLSEGSRVRISPTAPPLPRTFAERYGRYRGAVADLPDDLAEQHEHHRLGVPKR